MYLTAHRLPPTAQPRPARLPILYQFPPFEAYLPASRTHHNSTINPIYSTIQKVPTDDVVLTKIRNYGNDENKRRQA